MCGRLLAFAVLLSAASFTWACSESDAGAQCDAGEPCGMCLLLVNASSCSSMSYHGNTKCWVVERGEMCEGDGECGSDDDANNCETTQHGSEPFKDVYLRVPCRGEVPRDLRAMFLLLIASMLCGWLVMRAWRKAHLPDGRPSASLAAADGAGEVQLEAVPRVPVARGVLVPLAEVQVQVAHAQPVAEAEGREEAEEAEAQAAHDGRPVLDPESTEGAPPSLAEADTEPTEASGMAEVLQHAVEQRSVEQGFSTAVEQRRRVVVAVAAGGALPGSTGSTLSSRS